MLRRGKSGVLANLIAHLKQHPDHFGIVLELWHVARSSSISLTGQQMKAITRCVEASLQVLRRRLVDPNQSESVRAGIASDLAKLSLEGFPVRTRDARLIGALAQDATTAVTASKAVDALGMIGTATAGLWLERIRRETRFARVARKAETLLHSPIHRHVVKEQPLTKTLSR